MPTKEKVGAERGTLAADLAFAARGIVEVLKNVTDAGHVRRELSRFTAELRGNGAARLIVGGTRREERGHLPSGQDAQLNALLESLGEGVLIADGRGRLQMMNEAARSILGLGAEPIRTVKGLFAYDASRPDGTPLAVDEWPISRALLGETFDGMELIVRRPDGESRWLVATGTNVKDDRGEVSLAIIVFRDITELRRLEQRREEYAGLISHDLRGPLNGVLFSASVLKRSLQPKGLNEDVRAAERIEANAQRMNAMIAELVEATSLEAGARPCREPCDLSAIVSSLVDHMEHAKARMQIEGVDTPAPIWADPPQLERAVENLLVNALKYSPPESVVSLSVRQTGAEAILDVVDRGAGIASEDLPRLFERFYRARSGAAAGGVGLGLYIARLIAEAHGGRITVESEVGKGSTFRLIMPRRR